MGTFRGVVHAAGVMSAYIGVCTGATLTGTGSAIENGGNISERSFFPL